MTTHRQPRLAARREALYAWAFVAPEFTWVHGFFRGALGAWVVDEFH
jgi:hypothetical protein